MPIVRYSRSNTLSILPIRCVHLPIMNSSRQIGNATSTSFESSIMFSLTGRTSLSELLPGEIIPVPAPIVDRSPCLHQIVKIHTSTNPGLSIIPLPNIDPAGFKLFLDYLTQGHITFPEGSDFSLRCCIDLLYAHIIGCTFQEAAFQDHIIEELTLRLATTQSHDAQVLAVIFVEQGADETLKRFVVDKMFSVERRMVGLLKGGHESIVTGQSILEHKDITRPWNPDDDPELKAMADSYLGRTGEVSVPATEHRRMFLNWHSDLLEEDGRFNSSPVQASLLMSALAGSTFQIEKPLPELPLPAASPSYSMLSHPPSQALLPYTSELADRKRRQGRSCNRPDGLAKGQFGPLSKDSSQIKTEAIVTECLRRFFMAPNSSPPSCSCSKDSFSARIATAPEQMVSLMEDTPYYSLPNSPSYSRSSSRSNNSNSEDAKLIPPLANEEVTYRCSSTDQVYPISLIKRKAVPARGDDWVDQWHRLDALRVVHDAEQRINGIRRRRSSVGGFQ